MRESYRRPLNLMKKTFNDSIRRQSNERAYPRYSKIENRYDIIDAKRIQDREMIMQDFTNLMRGLENISGFFDDLFNGFLDNRKNIFERFYRNKGVIIIEVPKTTYNDFRPVIDKKLPLIIADNQKYTEGR
jgi:hypothetical protein